MATKKEKTCWFDQVGSQWEKEGTDPGNIWESHLQLSPCYKKGIMIRTKNRPGRLPTSLRQIDCILVRSVSDNKVKTLRYNDPLIVANALRLVESMC